MNERPPPGTEPARPENEPLLIVQKTGNDLLNALLRRRMERTRALIEAQRGLMDVLHQRAQMAERMTHLGEEALKDFVARPPMDALDPVNRLEAFQREMADLRLRQAQAKALTLEDRAAQARLKVEWLSLKQVEADWEAAEISLPSPHDPEAGES